MPETGNEKRTSKRVNVMLPAESRVVRSGGDGRASKALIDNLGSSGIKLRFAEKTDLQEEDLVYIKVETSQPSGFVNVKGQVRWVGDRADGQAGSEVGLQLTGMDFDQWDAWYDLLGWHDE